MFAAGLALICVGLGVWMWRLYFQKVAQDSSGADVEFFGLKFAVKNDALAIICFGIILIYLSSTLPVQPQSNVDSTPTRTLSAVPTSTPDAKSSTYFLQFGSFQLLANADNMRSDLIPVLKDCNTTPIKLVTSDEFHGITPGWYAVVLGLYSTRDEAEAVLLSILRRAGSRLKSSPQVRITSKT